MAMTYDEFGEFIGDESPYARKPDAHFTAGFTDAQIETSLDLYWDFRHGPPWGATPGDPEKALKVQNYNIVKAIMIPYSYNRILHSTFGGTLVDGATTTSVSEGASVSLVVKTHLLIGYTRAVVAQNEETPRPRIEPIASTTYGALGQYIKAQTPSPNEPELLAVDGQRDVLEIAISWLASLSAKKNVAGEDRLISTSDNEMDLIQEQQCLYWDFPLNLPSTGPGPLNYALTPAGVHTTDKVPPPPPFGVNWLRNFQVTKGIRASYKFIGPSPEDDDVNVVYRADILVGFAGGGGM